MFDHFHRRDLIRSLAVDASAGLFRLTSPTRSLPNRPSPPTEADVRKAVRAEADSIA